MGTVLTLLILLCLCVAVLCGVLLKLVWQVEAALERLEREPMEGR